MTSQQAAHIHRFNTREFIVFLSVTWAVSAMSTDMLLPAFPDMRQTFGLADDATDLSLTVTLFFVGAGVGSLFSGPLADAVGRKPVLAGSLLLFAASAALAASAPNLGTLYAARFFWGLAAAGPRPMVHTIIRDRHTGDRMSRIMALVMAASLMGPVLAPLFSAGLLRIGGWRWVLLSLAAAGILLLGWSHRFGETLADAHRRPFRFVSVMRNFGTVIGNPVTRGYLLAMSFTFGAFLSFLGSTELLLDEVFARPGYFVPYFAAVNVAFAASSLTANRALTRWSGGTLMTATSGGMVAASLLLLAVAYTTGGQPNVWLFLVVFSLANCCYMAFFPVCLSMALQPMGQLAGTATAVLNVVPFVLGALLGSLIDRAIGETITPVAVGYVAYSGVALLAQMRATRRHLADS